MRIVVGYTDTPGGRDALALAIRLASALSASLDLVLVLASDERATLTPPDAGYERLLHTRATGWLAKAAAKVPASIATQSHVVYAESFAHGLLETSKTVEGSLIVVGGANEGVRGRFSVGSVASVLLHAAVVPVVLAPKGMRKLELDGVARVTVAVGQRAGADEVVTAGIVLATRAEATLRLVSLVALDVPKGARDEAQLAAEAHATSVLDAVAEHLPASIERESLIASGKRIETAVRAIAWDPTELVLVGSSRLAASGTIFLGSTAARMLHELPVPMVVVPRDSLLEIGD